jgi:hypothetical protein
MSQSLMTPSGLCAAVVEMDSMKEPKDAAKRQHPLFDLAQTTHAEMR